MVNEVLLDQVLFLDCPPVSMLGLCESRFRAPPPLARSLDTRPGLTEPLHLGHVSRLHLVDALHSHKKRLGRDNQLLCRQLRCRLHHQRVGPERELERE